MPHNTLITTINNFHTDSAIAAFRGLANTCRMNAAFFVRMHAFRIRSRDESTEALGNRAGSNADKPTNSLDERNAADGGQNDDNGREDNGFEARRAPLLVANDYHCIAELAADELRSMTDNNGDAPMSYEQVLDWYCNEDKPAFNNVSSQADQAALAELLKAGTITQESVDKARTTQALRNARQWQDIRGEVLEGLKGLADDYNCGELEQLTVDQQIALFDKVIASMQRRATSICTQAAARGRGVAEAKSVADIIKADAETLRKRRRAFFHQVNGRTSAEPEDTPVAVDKQIEQDKLETTEA